MISDTILFGLSRKAITPKKPVSLAGLGPRMSQGVLDDLFVHTAWLQDGKKVILIIISLDLIWISRSLVDKIRAWTYKALNVPLSNVLICATHTHSGPQTRQNSFDGSSVDNNYMAFLKEAIRETILNAKGSLKEGYMECATGRTAHTINRRRAIFNPDKLKRFRFEKYFANRPNPEGVRDETVTALFLRSMDHDLKAIFFNFACHSSLRRSSKISKDFPAAIERELKKALEGDCYFFYLQGYAGNVRARLTRTSLSLTSAKSIPAYLYCLFFDRWIFADKVSSKEMSEFAQTVVSDFLNTMQSRRLQPNFFCEEKELHLPLQELPSKEYFERLSRSGDRALHAYATYVLKTNGNMRSIPFRIQRIRLSKDCCVVAMEGEMFAEYALFLRAFVAENNMAVLPVSCANGMAGYIPTEEAIAQGGYEPERSLPIFGLPAKFSMEIETIVKDAARSLFTDL